MIEPFIRTCCDSHYYTIGINKKGCALKRVHLISNCQFVQMFKVAVFEDITAGTQRRVIFDYALSMCVISLVS